MKFIFQYPETSGSEGDMLDCGPLPDVAAAAERAGFGGFSLTEHPVPGARWLEAGGHQSLDPFVALGHIAAVTQQLRLVTYVALAPYRNPFLLAKAAATVDKLSGGRLILGLGAGYSKTEFFALGVNFDERNALFDEVLEALPLHWKGEPFDYQGKHFEARNVIARPRPVQDPIPIWIGGNSRIALRRVARRAQGWMPMLASPEVSATSRTPALRSLSDVADRIAQIREEARAAGRGDRFDVTFSYGDTSIAQVTLDVDRHRERIAELEAAGVTWVVVTCSRREPAALLGFLEGFGETYCSATYL